jgi:hypothetical protein
MKSRFPTNSLQVHPDAAAFDVSAKYAATDIRFTRIPAGARQVDWHTVPGRVLTVRLDGSAEYHTTWVELIRRSPMYRLLQADGGNSWYAANPTRVIEHGLGPKPDIW